MIPLDQTTFGRVHGDCYRAVLASILEVPLDSFPPELGWIAMFEPKKLRDLLRPYDFDVARVVWNRAEDFPRPWPGLPGAWHLLGGASPREGLHATVGRDGHLVHDPHPSRAGLLPGPGDADILLPKTARAAELLQRPARVARAAVAGEEPAEQKTPWGLLGLMGGMIGMGFLAGRRSPRVRSR